MDANLGLAPHGVLANPMAPSMSKAQLQIKLGSLHCTAKSVNSWLNAFGSTAWRAINSEIAIRFI